MSKQWTIWLSNGLEANAYYHHNYDVVLRFVQDVLNEGDFDLDDIMIEELEVAQ